MSNTSNPLIDVNFVDATNYITPASTDDVTGIVLEANWGVINRPTVCDSTTFRALFNPYGLGRMNDSMAMALNYFDKGGTYLEVVRLGSQEVWQYITFKEVAGDKLGMVVTSDASDNNYATLLGNGVGVIRLRYAGGIPSKVTLKDSGNTITVGGSTVRLWTLTYSVLAGYTMSAGGAKVASYSDVETLTIAFSTADMSVSGVDYNYKTQVVSNSQWFTTDLNLLDKNTTVDAVDATTGSVVITDEGNEAGYNGDDYEEGYSLFRDRDLSNATLLINGYTYANALVVNSGVVADAKNEFSGVLGAMRDIAELRKDLIALVGCPTDSSIWGADEATTVTNIKTWFNTTLTGGGYYMFMMGLAAVEKYTTTTLDGTVVWTQDGTAGWAARIARVAYQQSNRNQLPSYKAFGRYSGVLAKTLNFDNVVALHEVGIGSMYTTVLGNYIFDIKSLYPIQTSYFGKGNVMRVTAAILANTFDMVEMKLHTDISSDSVKRIQFQSQLNTMLSQFIARGEIKAESVALCNDALNTDANTNGGEFLNIQLQIWYKKLTEKVNITVVAYDSTVQDVTISM